MDIFKLETFKPDSTYYNIAIYSSSNTINIVVDFSPKTFFMTSSTENSFSVTLVYKKSLTTLGIKPATY